MFSVNRVVAVVAQIVPGVADRAAAPGEEEFLEQRDCLVAFCAVERVDRRFVRVPRHFGAGFPAHRQELLVDDLGELLERTVFMIGVNLEGSFGELQVVAVEGRALLAGVVGHGRETAGHDDRLGNRLSELLIGRFLELDVLFEAHLVEAAEIRFVPDLPEADAAAVAVGHGADVFAPGVEFRHAAVPVEPVFRRLSLRRGGPFGREGEHRLVFDADRLVGVDEEVHLFEVPDAAFGLDAAPFDTVADDFHAAGRGGFDLPELIDHAPAARMGADAEQEARRASRRRAGGNQIGETAGGFALHRRGRGLRHGRGHIPVAEHFGLPFR